MTRTLFKILAVTVLAPAMLFAQSTATTAPNSNDVGDKIQKLEQMLQTQQQQIDRLREQLKQQQAAQQAHPVSLGEAASTTPVLPAASTAQAAPPQAGPAEQLPKKPDAIELMNGKIKIGALAYGDWGLYYETGFGPQFLTQTNYPGPGNDNFNSFDISRTYLNFLFIPEKHLTLRLTPNLYRQTGGATADKFGKVGAIGSSVDGNLTVRMKYAYAELNHLFDGAPALEDDNIRLGMQMNPLVDWEEGMYGYRFVNLTPWNFLSLSSTQVGVSLNGPVKINGKQYLDWQIGAFDDANFHQFEQSARKQVMARLSLYPMGATSKYQGLGLTGFLDYGFSNSTPDSTSTPLYRGAALAHYTSKKGGGNLALEYDFGRNAFGSGNLFSGGAPQDQFGLSVTPFAPMDALAKALLDGRSTRQRGFDVFGHIDIPNTKYSLFGMFQNFQPNTNVARNPEDFNRIVAGLAYKVNSHLRFALDSQNILYTHNQFTFTAAASDGLYAGPDVTNPVPKNTKAIFANMELSF